MLRSRFSQQVLKRPQVPHHVLCIGLPHDVLRRLFNAGVAAVARLVHGTLVAAAGAKQVLVDVLDRHLQQATQQLASIGAWLLPCAGGIHVFFSKARSQQRMRICQL